MKRKTKQILKVFAALTLSATMGMTMAFTTACNNGGGSGTGTGQGSTEDPNAPKVPLYVDGTSTGTVTATKGADEKYYLESAPSDADDGDTNTKFYKWYLDSAFGTPAVFPLEVDSNTKLYAAFVEEIVTTSQLTGKPAVGGKLDLSGATATEGDSNTYKWTAGDITFKLGGIENSIKMTAKNRSSTKVSTITLTNADTNTKVVEWSADGNGTAWWVGLEADKDGATTYDTIEYALPAGNYKLSRTNTIGLTGFESKEVVLKGIPQSMTVSAGVDSYLVGSTLDYSSITADVLLTSGATRSVVLSESNCDITDVKMNEPGTYLVHASYTANDVTVKADFNVYVYGLDSIDLGYNKILKGSNSAAGNSTYINHAVRQFYFKGETFSYDGLSVIANGKLAGRADKSFIVNEANANYSGYNMANTGKQTVTVKYTADVEKSTTFDIYVAEKPANIATVDTINLKVDKNVADSAVGTENSGAYQFKTIQQAIDFLNASGAKASAIKTINLAADTYWEKLEINVPNVHIVGAGKDTTKIEYDSLYGIKDESGFTHTTDSTATLNIRDGAEGFEISGVTISNAYNSKAYFDEKLGANYTEHRALAMLIQADKVIIDDCKILGYQDTIELFKGRQLIKNTYISGTTDFIFGTNNTTYFYQCTIHSIDSGKTDGGYITAFKGCNKGAEDYVTYGAIFDDCTFTADSGVVKKGDPKGTDGTYTTGNTAIARPWGAYAAVAVINSHLGGHISTTGYDASVDSGSKNQRYVSMSGVAPTVATAKFVEYSNDGDGAISSAVAGMKMLSASEAANYSNLAVIFGTTNGMVTYSSAWNVSVS